MMAYNVVSRGRAGVFVLLYLGGRCCHKHHACQRDQKTTRKNSDVFHVISPLIDIPFRDLSGP
jgi:hypothetical protein